MAKDHEPEAAAASPVVSVTFEQLKELLALTKETPAEKLALIEKQAQETAKANKALIRPENERHPGISVYSYPEGDVARPRPKLECRTFWVAEEIGYDTTTAEELELLNQVKAGRYHYTRGDGTRMPIRVEVERDQVTGKPAKKTIWFDTRGSLRHNLPPRTAMCREIIAQQMQSDLVTA